MLQESKRQLYMGRKDFMLWAGVGLGVGLAVMLVEWIVLLANPGIGEMPALVALCSYFASGLFGWIYLVGNIGVNFNLALKMGAQRRRYLGVCLLLAVLMLFLMFMAGTGLGLLERAMLRQSGAVVGFSLEMPVWLAALLAVAIAIVGGWSGAMMLRYGKNSFWIIWALSMVFGIGSGQVAQAMQGESSSPLHQIIRRMAALFGQVPLAAWQILALVLALAAILHFGVMMRRVQAVD